mgnify:CR=1 FL=1
MRRLRFVVPLLLCLALATVALATVTAGADVIVHLPNGNTIFRRTTFDTPTISAVEELQRSGLLVETSGSGKQTTVCRIEGVGCPSSDCFCACHGGACNYWAFWRFQNGQWSLSNEGAGTATVANGALDVTLSFTVLVVLSLLGVLLYALVDMVERWALPWHVSQRAIEGDGR